MAREQHTEHVGPGVVEPALTRLVHEGKGPEPAHPFVRRRRHLWLGRACAELELRARVEERLRPRRGEVHADAETERQRVMQCDRPLSGDGLSVDRTTAVDQHTTISELWKKRVDGIVES